MAEVNFSYEFYTKIPDPNDEMRDMAESRLRALTEGHDDVTGAAVSMSELTHEETPNYFQARVVVYVRPTNIVAIEKDQSPLTALKNAISATERQVREKREKLRQQWKQP